MSGTGITVHCQRQDILVALQAADMVVPSSSAKPILTNLLLDARPDALEVIATDLQLGLRAFIRRIDVQVPGQVVVPAGKLVAILKESRSATVTLTLEEAGDRSQLVIDLADGTYRVPAVVGETFPEVSPFTDGGIQLRLAAVEVDRMIRKSAFAVDRERTSAVLAGVLLAGRERGVLMAATDGKVLGECRTDIDQDLGDEGFQAIVPASTIDKLKRVLDSGSVGEVDLAIASKLFFARLVVSPNGEEAAVQVELTSRLIDGAYPPYRNALPSLSDDQVRFRKSELASAVRRTALMTNASSRGIVMALESGSCQLSNLFNSTGSVVIPVECSYAGPGIRLGLNAQYLADVLKVLDQDDIDIELHGQGKGLIIREELATFLIMPITIAT